MPIATDACWIRSQLKPEGHLGAAGSQTTRAFGTLGFSEHAEASARAAANATMKFRRD
jgi:hypothetical protein